MKRRQLYHLGMFLFIMGCVSFINVNGQDLEQHTWKNRLLVIKTSESSSELYQDQVKEFSDEVEELNDRKFMLYRIIGEDFELIDFANPEINESGKIGDKSIGKILDDKENFEVILIGLDGGVKLRQTEILRKEDLYGLVDSMPMRRNELNKKID